MLMVSAAPGDPGYRRSVKHGTADARLSIIFTELDSTADFNGLPSLDDQGSYDLHGRRPHTWNRSSSQTGAPPASATWCSSPSRVSQRGPSSLPDIEAIIAGFVVAAK